MEDYHVLPISLGTIERMLKSGQRYTFQGCYANGTPYTFELLSKGNGYTLIQNGVESPFNSLEVALCTILNCLGDLA